jgi:hypothetical protein
MNIQRFFLIYWISCLSWSYRYKRRWPDVRPADPDVVADDSCVARAAQKCVQVRGCSINPSLEGNTQKFQKYRNIKNRWSGGGTQHPNSVGTSSSLVNGGGIGDEEQALLPDAESPFDSPAHRVVRKSEEPPDYSTAALSSKNILVDTVHSNFRPTSTELQRAINQSIFSAKRPESGEKKETVC